MSQAAQNRQADWYFDFISPFAYFQFMQQHRLPSGLTVTFKPVLFAGLLNHWEHKGPAEIPAKRIHTYRFCKWYGDRHGISFTMPPAHPFNPLKPLRLAIALGATREAIATIFDALYGDGLDISDGPGWETLVGRLSLDLDEAERRIAAPAVKGALRANTEEATGRGVFGVPTFVIDNEVFWGVDATDMFIDYLNDPRLFHGAEMARLGALPIGKERPR